MWSFDLRAWGECTQASTETQALSRFATRLALEPRQLRVVDTIEGPEALFLNDRLPATGRQIARTIEVLDEQRGRTLSLIASSSESALDVEPGGLSDRLARREMGMRAMRASPLSSDWGA